MHRRMLAVFILTFIGISPAFADTYKCEILSLEGHVWRVGESGPEKLTEGSVLNVGDTINVGPQSYADLSYDSSWQNVTRIGENSTLKISSIFPTSLKIASGSVYARLMNNPGFLDFQVTTPTAVASVRGTVFYVVSDLKKSQVYNYSDSPVQVEGNEVFDDLPVTLQRDEKTETTFGSSAANPLKMTEAETAVGERLDQEIRSKIETVTASGRKSKIQVVPQMDLGQAVTIVSIKRGKLEDASYYNPMTRKSGPIEGGMKLPSYCVLCMNNDVELEVQGADGKSPTKVKGKTIDSLQKVVEGKAAESKTPVTNIWVTEGSVKSMNRLLIGDRVINLSQSILDAEKPTKSEGQEGDAGGEEMKNQMTVTPCGLVITNYRSDPCKEVEDKRKKIEVPKPADLEAMEAQDGEEDVIL
jgi:hypothetical protein